MNKSNTGIESYAEIKRHLDLLRERENAILGRVCYMRVEGLKTKTMECWCRGAGPDGRDQPCAPAGE